MLPHHYIFTKQLRVFIGIVNAVFLVAISTISSLYADEKDSLRQDLLKNTLSDTERAHVLDRLVGLYMEAKPDSAIFYALQLQIIAERNIPNKNLMLMALNALVNGYIHYDKSGKVLKYGFQLLHLSEELHDTAYRARAFYAIGHASGQLFTKNDTKENTSALHYLRQALTIAERQRDTVLMAQCYNATGRIYRKKEQFDSALVFHNEALRLATAIKQPIQQGWAFHSLAICYENKGNRTKALEYALEGLRYREQVGNGIITGFSLALVTHLYQQIGNLRQALHYAERGLALANVAEFRTAQYQAYERVAQVHEALGNYREALFYQRRFAAVRDSVAALERTEDLRSLQAELKLEQSERERILLKKEQEAQDLALQRQQILAAVLTLGFILLGITVVLLLRVQGKQNFQRQEIAKLKRILDESTDYVMMSDIASGRVLYMNKAYLSLINAETPPVTLSELLHRVYAPATAETVLNTHLPLVIKHEQLHGETTLLDHKGRQVSVLHTTICHYDEQGIAVLVSSVMRDITEIKQAEKEILAHSRFTQTVTDSLPGMLAYWTDDLRCSFANSAYLEWFGKTHEEMIGIEMHKLLGEKLFQKNESYIRTALEGKFQQFERELVKANGETGYTLAQYIPDIADGRVLGFIALVTDITMVKKAQNSLNEAQHLTRIGSWEWDIASNTTTWSDEQYRLFGENRDSYQPTLEGYYNHLTIEEQQKTATLVQKTLAGTAEYSIEHEITRPDGTVLFVLEQGTVISDKNHKPLRMVGTTQDITERKRMEDELRKLSMVASKTTNAVYMTDTEGNITWVNNGFTRLTEYSIDEALGKRPGHLLRGEKTDPTTIQTINEALRQGKSFDVELLNYTKSKNPFWLHIIADPIVDDFDTLTGFITIQTDITERKRAEEQQLQKLSMVASKTTNAVVITDASYQTTWVNEGYTRLTGYSLDEVRGEEPRCSAQQLQIDQLTMKRMRNAVAERVSFEGEVMNYSKSGRLYWVHIKTDPFFDEDGTLAGFVSIKTDVTERKQAEQLLKDSEERYRLIFENSNEGMIQTHPDGKIETVNSVACSIFGRSKEELSQMSRADIVDMSDPRLPAILQERNKMGYVKGELNFVRGNGTIFPGEFSSSIYVDSKGEQHIIVFLRDVSERKRAEEALRQSEGNLRALFESSVQAYYLIDKNYTVLSFNKVAQDLVKSYYGRTLAIGDSILDYTIPDIFMRCFHRALQGEWVTDEGIAIFPNNQRRFFEAIYSPVRDDKNELIGISYNMLDITERKELQTQVIEYSSRLQSIIVSMMDGVVLLNEQRTISLTNPAAEEIFGYAGEELFLQPLTMLLPDKSLEVHEQRIENFLRSSPSEAPHHKSHIVQGRHKSGNLFPMEASIAHFMVEGRLFLLAVVRDITKRLETEEEILELNRTLAERVEERTAQLVKLNKEKDEFLGIAAHDLKNPLAAIRSSAQIIEECFTSGEAIDITEYTDSIIATSDEMLDIITNFLDIELIENGKLGLAFERVPHTIVQKAVTAHQRRAKAKDITLHYKEPMGSIAIIADKLALRQVLDNLLSNAIKFSPRSKHIYIRVEEKQKTTEQNPSLGALHDHYLHIEIQDEGPGVGIDEQEQLFTKFTRLSAKPTGEEGSTGLGLSIVKKLVEMMNGSVRCESAKGEGATFIVELPVL